MRGLAVTVIGLTVAAGAAAVVGASPAGAVGDGVNWSTIPSPVPSKIMPKINDGTVYAITQVGNTIVVGGSFTSVTSGSQTLTRANLLAFDATTGAVSATFVPTVDNTVQALAAGPTAGTVFVAGNFNTVNGVRSKGITLLNLADGSIVSGFNPASLNGIVYAVSVTPSRLYITGTFTTVGGVTHDGIASLVPTTGKLDPYVNVQLTGHHNYNGTGANGAVGGRSMAVNPAGTRAIVVGNFKNADGVLRDQIVQIDLDTTPNATVDPSWLTSVYTAACIRNSFDTYVTDVQYSADGSYFAVSATGGGSPSEKNTDGTRALCDSVARFEANSTGADVQPTWVDFTGRDSLWSVIVTGAAIYVGGHERWLNNYWGVDNAQQGAVPRPSVAALDPTSGVPLDWNPGRNPRGAGTYALFAGSNGLYIGGDQTYVGNRKYNTGKVAMFPLAGGRAPAVQTIAALPANVYLASPGTTSDQLGFVPVNGPSMPGATFGATQSVPNTGVAWSSTRGAFTVGNFIYYAQNNNLYRASFDGTTVGTPQLLDAYDDPTWATVSTGSGQTYQGVKPTYLSTELPSITGAFYSNGRIYYTLAGKSALYSRWFSPDSGIIGAFEFAQTNVMPTNVTGMMLSGSTLYYASSIGGALHARSFTNGTVGTIDSIVDATHDWRARSLFLYGQPTAPDNPPKAVMAQPSCTNLTCSFDGSASTDPDNDSLTYSWDFGDGSTGSGPTPSHLYATAGTYPVVLTVSDGRGGTSTASTTVTPTGTVATISNDGANSFNSSTKTVQDPAVAVPGQVGDTVLLYVGVNTAGLANTVPAGWTQVAQFTNSTLQTTVYRHVVAAGDPASVTVHLDAAARVDLQALAYSGVASTDPPFATASDANTNTHTTPTANGANPGAWAVSYWSDRTSAGAETWALPAGVTSRQVDAPPSGSGRVDSAVADQPVSGSSYGGQSATVTTSDGLVAGRGTTVTVLLNPAIN